MKRRDFIALVSGTALAPFGLRAQPEARDACLAIEDAIGKAGMPSTWQSGI